jgi:hypothetical protein
LTYPHWGGFEGTKIHGSGKDVLGTTRHIERWQQGLGLPHDSGIRTLRYPIPWHRIERKPGELDFRWLDGPMCYLCRNGMRPVADPMHHTSSRTGLREVLPTQTFRNSIAGSSTRWRGGIPGSAITRFSTNLSPLRFSAPTRASGIPTEARTMNSFV